VSKPASHYLVLLGRLGSNDELWGWIAASLSIWKFDAAIQNEFPEQLDYYEFSMQISERLIRSAFEG
jgi:hypothetical protein